MPEQLYIVTVMGITIEYPCFMKGKYLFSLQEATEVRASLCAQFPPFDYHIYRIEEVQVHVCKEV